jgi:hypothetical protein
MEDLHIIRRLGTAPLHHKCDDELSNDVTILELSDGPNTGDFVIIGTGMPEDDIAELHKQARALEDIGGVASYESVVTFRGLAKAVGRILPITEAELEAIKPITPLTRAPRDAQ